MQPSAGEPRIPEAIASWYRDAGARQCFGVTGSTNFEVTRALVDRGVTFVPARHETNAVVMAESWALVTGDVALVSVHTGPGLTNAATGIAEAAKSRTPMVVLTGDIANGAVQSNFAMDQAAFCSAVGAVPERLHSPRTAVIDAARAYERALRERCVVVLSMPLDVQGAPASAAKPAPRRLAKPERPVEPAAADITELADLLEAAERPVIVGGHGALLADAREPLREVARRVGALLATTARAHGLFAGDAWSLGISGGFGSPAVGDLLPEADVVVGFGATFTKWTTRFGKLLQGAHHIVQVDAAPARLGVQRPIDLGITADARLVAERVLAELERRGVDRTGWRTDETAERVRRGANNTHPYDDASTDSTIDPRTLTKALDELLPLERTLVTDGGHFSGWPTRHLRVPDGAGWVFKQNFMSIGLGLGTAIGAAVARPDRLTVMATGDGGFMMSIPDLETAVRLGLNLAIIVYNDSAYGAEVHHFEPLGLETEIVRFPMVDFARIGRGYGADGVVVARLEDLEPVRKWVSDGAQGVFIIDVRVPDDLVADWVAEAMSVEHD
jgi:thiamine pyrophosphate-dependent acetolactate synthase large subunit-like protein